MHRRALLVTLAGLSGCTSLVGNPLGGGSDSTSGSDDSGDSGGSGTDAPPEQRGTDTASEQTSNAPTETQTPSATALDRMSVSDLLALSREQLSRAVETYTDAGRTDSLTGVTAATERFDPDAVVEQLYAARRAYEAADRQGLPADVQTEINRLAHAASFLRLSIDAQVLLIEAHDDLEEIATAIQFVDPETARSLTDRVGGRQERTKRTIAELSNDRYERAVTVVDSLSRAEYLAKRDQFTAERNVLEDVYEALPKVVEGVALFAQARGRRQSGAPYAAADLSREAESAFTSGSRALRDVGSRIPRHAQGFDGVVATLRTGAEDGRVEARAFYRDIET